ncbi:hypothetical protein JCM18750_37080 [Halostagnicola bangensis]
MEHSLSRNGTEDGAVFGLLGNPKHSIHTCSEQMVHHFLGEAAGTVVLHPSSVFSSQCVSAAEGFNRASEIKIASTQPF